jgi:hypothetical protein
MKPEKTTLEDRLEFYEWALENKTESFICHKASEFYNVECFQINDLKRLFPELYKRRDKTIVSDYVLWISDTYCETSPRIEAL